MPITVLNHSKVPIGPFSRTEVASKLQTGEISLNSLAFVEGMSQWTPLRDVLARIDAGPELPAAPPPPLSVLPPAVPGGYSYAVTMQPPPHLVYAGFWLRFLAYLVDSIILGIPVGIIVLVAGLLLGGFTSLMATIDHSSSNNFSDNGENVVVPVGIILGELSFAVTLAGIVWLYFALQESSLHQATWGKRAMNLKVTDMAGERLSFGHATGRFFSKVVTKLIPFGIGYMMAGFTARKQAVHDMIAGTLVVRG